MNKLRAKQEKMKELEQKYVMLKFIDDNDSVSESDSVEVIEFSAKKSAKRSENALFGSNKLRTNNDILQERRMIK